MLKQFKGAVGFCSRSKSKTFSAALTFSNCSLLQSYVANEMYVKFLGFSSAS